MRSSTIVTESFQGLTTQKKSNAKNPKKFKQKSNINEKEKKSIKICKYNFLKIP